ncbi:MAG: 2-amino-4-hydroxy-6-hydroxymethyldihydropteridine diphosphokinase [Candidatus Margulisiibacteriota bacterium]
MRNVFLGLGSNLGDREKNIEEAILALNDLEFTEVIKHSSNYETQALDAPEGTPDFLNAAVEIETELSPADLLEETKAIEIKLGRTQKNSVAPRTIDIDLLLYNDEIILDENLTIPHPLMHERHFVLSPLNEIAPDFLHPILEQPVCELLSDLWV